MTRKTGTLCLAACGVLVFAPGAFAFESFSLFRSFGVAPVPEISGLDSLAPVAVVTLLGFAGYGIRNAYRKISPRKPE